MTYNLSRDIAVMERMADIPVNPPTKPYIEHPILPIAGPM